METAIQFNRTREELLAELHNNCSGKSRFDFEMHSKNIEKMMEIGQQYPEIMNTMEAVELSLVVLQKINHPDSPLKIYQHLSGTFLIMSRSELSQNWLPLAISAGDLMDGYISNNGLPMNCDFIMEI